MNPLRKFHDEKLMISTKLHQKILLGSDWLGEMKKWYVYMCVIFLPLNFLMVISYISYHRSYLHQILSKIQQFTPWNWKSVVYKRMMPFREILYDSVCVCFSIKNEFGHSAPLFIFLNVPYLGSSPVNVSITSSKDESVNSGELSVSGSSKNVFLEVVPSSTCAIIMRVLLLSIGFGFLWVNYLLEIPILCLICRGFCSLKFANNVNNVFTQVFVEWNCCNWISL